VSWKPTCVEPTDISTMTPTGDDPAVSAQEQRNDLHPTETQRPEKLNHVDAELESILEAIGVGGDASSVQEEEAKEEDLEKVATHHTTAPHEPVHRVVTAQDWTGPDDPENPMNWTIHKRSLHMGSIAFLAFAVTAGSSMITPSTPEIAEHFHVSRTAAVLSLSLFTLGLAIGPVIAAPISEMYGRSVVYKSTGFVYMLFILGAGFSKTFGGLLVCRLIAGIVGGPVLAVGAGSNADMFPQHIRAIPGSLYVLAPFLGPALGMP
jgi:Ca2+/Na+ antiporter